MPYSVAAIRSKNFGSITLFSISGIVYDADGTTAVSGATVALGAASTTSGADGTYTISGLAAGTNGSLTCTKSGYSWASISVSAMGASLTAKNFINAWYATGGNLANCPIAYKAIGSASQAASYVNLVNPGTNDITLHSGSVSWTSGAGWDFSAAGRLNTGYTAPNSVNRSMFVRFSNGATDATNRVICACANGGVQLKVANSNSQVVFANGNGGDFANATVLSSGVVGISALDPYINGSDVGNITAGASYDETTNTFFIGDRTASASVFFLGKVQAFVAYNTNISAAAAGILSTAMVNLS